MSTRKKTPTSVTSESDLDRSGSSLSDPCEWVKSHGDYLYRFALLRLREPQLAEDAVQDTLLAALKARNSFGGHSTERTWLTGILKRKIIDHFRRTAREVDAPPEDLSTGHTNEGSRPREWLVDPNDPAERREFWAYLNNCLDLLPQKTAVLFVLREIEYMPVDEICNILAMQPTNLRVRLHRARKQLRRCLEQHWMEVDKVSP